MLQPKRAILLLGTALLFSPLVMGTPAQAQPRNSHRTVVYSREVYPRVVRLRNGDYRLSNGQVVSSRRVVRLRTAGYYRLPNGDIILPSQEVVPVRRVVRQSNGLIRLPNGILIRL
ncbi:hypothetical protein CLI64_26110 [Nostoc sp. CENA543]|uniref:hypothetical protein n=1 Tax=Nostoc sp. CENA543 TaxID=1869241 RepID=UPI000CA10C63|nr:hypothetical protein [Nostoc sp. CENA543]AUT03597.1 hypothetical protein CLI64_26110 [Nostoc sp. CENA543]